MWFLNVIYKCICNVNSNIRIYCIWYEWNEFFFNENFEALIVFELQTIEKEEYFTN